LYSFLNRVSMRIEWRERTGKGEEISKKRGEGSTYKCLPERVA
jgi:hypothetical protein